MPELTNSHVTMPGQTTNQESVPEQTKCRVGACKRFECRVIGYPRPSVRWFKDGKNITADGRYKFDYTADGCVVLVIENVTARDQGLYECRAENTEGAAETAAQLYVKGTHYETEPEEDVSVLSLSFRPVETSTPRSQRRPLVLADEELVTDPLNRNDIDESVDSNDLTTNGWPVDTLDISTIGDDTISDSGRQSGKEVKSDEDVAESEHSEHIKESAEQNNQVLDQLGDINVRLEDIERDRSETSVDSVLGIESEIQGSTSDKGSDTAFDITADSNVDYNKAQLYDDVFTHDTEISNAQTNNDDALNCVADISTSNDRVNDWEGAHQPEVSESYNRNEELNNEIEDLVTMDKSGDPHSRRWATDSGVASRGSSLSSDTDFAIATDSMREMQAYLHGRKDDVYESFEHTSETTVEHKVVTEMKTSMSSTSMSDAESGIEHFENESVDILSTESISSLSTAQAETSQTEQLLSGELDLDGIRRRHNLVDEQDNDFTWESIEDSEQSVIAGKFLFARGPGTEEVKEMAHIYSEMETLQQHEETQMLARESETCQTQSQKVETASSESQVLTMQSKSSKTELDSSDTLEEHTTRIDNDVDFRTASEITEDTSADSFEKASGIKQDFKSAANANVESEIEGKSEVDVCVDTSDIVGERVMTIDSHSDIINASAVTYDTSAGSVNEKKTSHIVPTETTETTITGDVASLESSKMKHKLKGTSIDSLPIANRKGEIELNTASSEMSSDMQHETTIEHITSKDSDLAEMTSVDEIDSTLKALDINVKTVTKSESVLITHSQLMHEAQVEAVTGDQDAEINEQSTELKPISIAETPDTDTFDTSDKERVLGADSYEGVLDTSIPSSDTFIDNDTDKPATSVDDIDVCSSGQGDASMNGNTSMVDDIDEISNMRLAEHEPSMVDSEMKVNTEISNTGISEIELGKSDELDMENVDKMIVDMTSADRKDLAKTEQEDTILTGKSLTEETNNESDNVDNKGDIEKELATSEAKSETKPEQPISIESSTETKPSANVESAIGASEISIGMPDLSAGIDMEMQIVPLETDIVADSMPISKVDEDKQESTHVDKVKESTPPDKPLDQTDITKTNANMENKSEEESKEAETVGNVEIQKNIIPSETTQEKPSFSVDSTTETAGSPNVDTVVSDLEIANSTSDLRARFDNGTVVAPRDLEIESMLTPSVNVGDNREIINKVTYQMDDNMKYDTRAKSPLESMKDEDADEDTTLSAQEAVHKTMHRDDADKGKLDYEYADDAEARLAAGRYLFYCATPEVEEEDIKETAKELHYWKEAEAEEIKMQSLDETEMELPVKEITETTESSSDMNTDGKESLAAVTVGEALDDQVDKLEISAEIGETICQDSIKASSDHVDQIEKRKLASANLDKADIALNEASVKQGDGAVEDYSSSERNTNEIMEQPDAIIKQESAYSDEVKDNTSLDKPKDKETCAKTETDTKEEHVSSSKRIDETVDEAVLIDKQEIASAIQLNDSKELDETIKKMRVKAESESKKESITNDRIEIEDTGMPKTEITNAGEPDSAEIESKFKATANQPTETIDTIDGNELSKEPQTIENEQHQIENKATNKRDESGSQEARDTADTVSPAECKKMPKQKHENEVETEMDDNKQHKHNDAVIDLISEHQKASNENETRQLEPQVDGASIESTKIQTHERAREIETTMEDNEQDKHKETDIEISDQHKVTNDNETQQLETHVEGVSAESTAVEHWMDVGKSGAIEFKVNVTAVPADTHPADLKDTEPSESTSLTDSAATLEADTPFAVDHVSRPDDGMFTDKPQEVGLNIDDIKDSLKFTEVTSKLDTSEIDSVEAGFPEVLVVEGEPIHIEWNIHAISESEYHVYKDGFKIKRDDRLVVTYTTDTCALDIASAALSDEATYSIRVDNRDEDLGCIDVLVNELEPGIDRILSEPSFLVEPTVEIEGGRRLSIKCSVCGVPEPDVTWFIEGQQLGQCALWDTYSKDGFYHLGLVDPSFLDCEEIVCRVENEAGFIQNVVKLKRDGYEISLEPVLPTAEVVTPVVLDVPPIVNLEITESKERYKKLKAYILPGDHCDRDNMVTFKQGEIVELLGTNLQGAILARNGRQKKKIGYLPSQMMLDKYGPADDVRTPESQTLAIRQTPERKQIGTTQAPTQQPDTQGTTQQATQQPDIQEEPSTMPERRTASSPGLHGTPRKKPKDRESPSELDRRLGFKENLTAKKDTSQDHVRLTEYEDGTTRPMFKRRLRRIVADEGQLSQLECVISGTPQPKVLWLKNNRPLKASDGCQVVVDEESNILVFPKVSEDDAGVYTARAMNVNGSVMCTAELALSDGKAIDPGKEPTGTPMDLDFTTPAYFFQMSSCQVEEGRLARFDCRVVAYPKPEIVWMKDGKVVESEDRFKLLNFNNEIYSLLIQDVQHEDSGRYTCWARNKFGEAMTEAFLNVISLSAEDEQEGDQAPKFFTKFYDQQTTEGLEADFKCLIGGRPAPSVTWLLDDIELQDAPGVRLRRKDGMASLEVKSPTVDQSGQYTCHITNALGEATCSAHLTVIENKLRGKMLPKFLKKFDHVTVREGEEAVFTAVVVGEPKAKVTWMYNDKPLDASRRFVMKQDGDNYTLTVKNTRFDDSGKISCKAVNEEGEVYCYGNLLVRESRFMRDTPEKLPYKPESAKVDSKFGYIPTFTKRLQDTSVNEGGQARLECKVMGIPEPEVTWMKDGRVIPPVGRYHEMREGETCRLTIDNVRPEDQGVYTCIVSNNQGKSSSSAEVKMAGAGKKDTYTPDRTLADSYLKRPYGESPERFEALPKILAVPKMPYDRPTLLNKRDDSVRLAWLPAPTHDLPMDGRRLSYTIESKEIGGPRRDWKTVATDVPGNTYNVRNLRPDREYEFRVRAQNQYGPSEPTRPSTLEKRVDDVAKIGELPEVRAPPRLPTHRPIITDMGEDTVRLAWRPVEPYKSKRTPPVSYRLEAKELPGRDWMPMSESLRDTTHYLSDLSRERDYMIRVRAENDFGVSEPTEPLWLPRATAFPGVPISRPEIVELEPQRARLSWSRVDIPAFGLDDAPLTYMLEAAEPPHDWRTIARDIDDTDYTVDGLKPGRDYRFRVRAKTPAGVVSEPSPAVSLYSTLAKSRAPVDRLEVLDLEPETRSAHLGWSRVEIPPYNAEDEPLMYMIEYNEPPVDDWRPLVTGVPTNQYRVMNLDPERDYNFRIRALTPYGVSPPSATLPVSLRHTPDTRRLSDAVIISDVDSDSLQLSWRRPMVDPSQDVSYQIQMLEQPLLDWRPVATGVTDTTYKVHGLRPKRDYQFRVIPQIGSRPLEPIPTVALSATAVRPRLHAAEPQLTELGPESVRLSWRPAEVPVYERKKPSIYYGVEKMELPSGSWVPAARRLTDTQHTLTGLRPDRDYRFRVTAETDTLTASEPSMAATMYRRPAPMFSRDEPVIRDLSPNVVTMSWHPAAIPAGLARPPNVTYNVEVQSPPGMSAWTTLYAAHATPSARLADLRPDKDYLVRVRAQYDDHVTEPTLPVYIPRRAVPPRMPVEEPYVVDVQPESVKLQWRSADLPMHIMDYSPISYRIEGRELPGGQWVNVARGVPHTDFTITGLAPDKDYEFRVKAENNYGLSDATRPITLTKRAVAPVLAHDEPLMYDLGPGSARLSWRPATMPSHLPRTAPTTYTIQVQDAPSKTWRPYIKRIPHTSYYVSGLDTTKDYNFRVVADNDFGSSRPTQPVYMPKYADLHVKRPISMPEVDEFDDDLTSVKLHWKPRAGSPFDSYQGGYQIESWEPVKRKWRSVAKGIPGTSYHLRDLPAVPDHLFRVRMETDHASLSEPSLPVSVSRYLGHPRMPIHRPQLYEVDLDSAMLSWQPVHVQSRRPVRYSVEQREIPEPKWRHVGTDILDTNYRLRSLRPKSDYEFRVRALIDGESSEPSFPVPLYRKAAIPRVQLDTPEVHDVVDDALTLRWNKVDVPAFSADDEPLTFIVERQQLPSYEWEPVATDITDSTYRVKDLQPYQDYSFRIRGLYPSGYTEPSPAVPVYRRPIRQSVPIARPEVWEEDPYSARLQWQRAYIPRYYGTDTPRYRIEMQDVGPAAQALDEWRPVATNVTTPAYTVNELSPRKDYKFRIREELENGDLSEPTPPIHYYRTQMPMTREPFMLAEYKPVDYTDTTFANRTYVQHLTKFVPPRMPIDKPEMVVINPETVELAWKPARVPEAIRNSSNLTYTIEVRTPPSFDWRELTSGLKVLNHTVKKLHTRIDYVFRVRAWNEYGCSEPGLPVSLYRPKIHDTAAELAEEELWEQDFERRFSQQVPPKLPMDTPKVLTRSPESIWLSWKPARIPAYATQTPITYYIEVKRAPGTSYHREVSGLVDCQYIMEGLNPSQDYSIQVRAETEHGVSDPTLPVLIQRSKPSSRPGSRRSSLERDLAAEEVNLETMRLDNVTAGAPPRMSSHRPLASNVHPDHLTMTWSAARLPSYVKHSQITYIIERRDLPSHVWTVLARDVTDMRYDVKGLSPDTDYMFRVKARNEFGLSEPTLPMSIYRDRDDYVPQKIRSRSDSRDSILSLVGRRGRRGSSVDYTRPDVDDVDVCMRDKIPTQPEYATAVTSDTQYGTEGKKGRISLQVRGFPLPTINWYLNDEKLEYGEGYNAYVTPTGGVTLEINNITPGKIGQYKCFAQNGSGSAIKMIDFRPADPPTVLEPLKDVVSQSYRDVTLTCRADGTPAPTVKWMKDWRPITESSRVTVSQEAPDTWSITLTNVLTADGGVYACSIENMGGKVTSAARLTVEEDAPAIQDISLKSTPIEDAYHILEEVDRDRHSVHRRVIEKATGKSYVAKFISLRNKAQKNFFLSEFEMLRALSQTEGVVTLHDAFETDRSLVLITEPLSGKPVTDQLLADGNWAERDVADVIRRLLGVMTTLQSQDIVHLDIKPSNVWLGGASGRDVIMTGFDLARQLLAEEEITHNYGSVGYTSPEQITDGVISPTTDTWAVGVLAYALLSGALPFDGPTDIDVLQRTKDCLWSFGDDFENISQEGRDFISKLLVKDPRERMTVARCLSHAWLTTSSDSALDVAKLRRLSDADKQERESHSVNTTANLQSLLKLMHGESALYQPAIDQDSGEIIFPDQDEYGDFLDEDAWYEWNLQCRDDPDVQEFPLASKEFRIRESRHTAADDAPSDKETDEHADSEEAGANIMFRNKIQNETFMVGDDVTFSCTVVSPDSPAVVTWYRDETLLSDAYRAEPTFTDDGVARLTIRSAKDYDAGVYKCVARNKDKRVSCQARLLLGNLPGKPGRPVVTQTSGTEVFLTWTGPVSDGNAYLLGYRVDYKAPGDVHWTRGPYVTEDYAIIGGLAPSTEYMFRISCHNKYGTSPYSWASIPITTKDEDAPPITMSSNLAPLLQFSSFSRQQMTLPVESRRPSVTAAEPATTRDGRPEDDYKILDTISRGKFAEYKNCTHIATNTARVMKIVPYTTDRHSDVTHEFETLKSIRQINIVTVIESYVTSENFYVIFERLSGINVIEYLCLRKTYTEEMVARIVRQVMDALQHLKHYGIAHLNLQPSSVVMATRKRLHVKLRDFTQSREIESGKELPMTPAGYTDFIAAEIIQGEPVGHPADVWSLGVLTFALLSGVSPFAGKDIHETLTHVIYGRYSNMDLYDNVSKESAKFINKLLKRIASNRPTINKCLDSRWLHLSDSMMKSRTSRHFRTERLREFQAEYQQRRADDKYTNVGGVKPEDLPKPTVGPLRKPVIHEKIMRRDLSIQLRKSRLPLKTSASAKQVAELSELKSETIESAVKKRNEMATGLATLDTMPDFFIQLNQLKSEMDKLFCSTQSLGDSAETVSKAADVVTKDLEILTTKLEEVKEPEKEFEKQTDNSELEREVNDSDVFDSNVSGKPDLIEISEVLPKQLRESSLINDVTSSVDDLDDKTVEALVSKDIRARECDIESNVIESEENIPSEIESLEMRTDTDTDNKSTEDTVEQNKDTGACITSEKDRVSPLAPETAAQDVHLEKGDGYIQAETQAAIETVQVVDTGSQLQPSIVNSDETIVPNDTTDDVQKDNFEAHNVAFTDIDEVHVNKPSVVDKPDGRVINDESTEETKSSELSDDRKISHDSELKISGDVVTTESVESTKADACASKVDMTSKTNTQLDELVEEIKPCETVDEKTLSPERDIKTCDEIENVDDKPVSNTLSDELIDDSKAGESNNEQHKESPAVENGTRDEASHDESGESKVNLVEIKDSDILPCEKEDKILADIDTTIDNQNDVSAQDIVEENVIPETRAKPTKSILKKLDDTFALSINKDTPLSLPEEIKLGEAENVNNVNIQNEVTTPSTIVSDKSEVVEASEKETAKEQSPEPVEEDNIVPELKPKHELASSQYFPKDEVRRDSSQAYITPEADSELYFSAEEDVDGVTIGDTATTKPTKAKRVKFDIDISQAVMEKLMQPETNENANTESSSKHYKQVQVESTDDHETVGMETDDTKELEVENKTNQSGDYIAESTSTEDTPITESKYVETSIDNDASKLVEVASGTETQTELASVDDTTTDNVGVVSNSDEYMKTEPLSEDIPPVDRDVEDSRSVKPQSNSTQECKPCESVTDGDIEHTESKPEEAIVGETKSVEIDSLYSKAISTMPMQSEPDALMIADVRVEDIQSKAELVEKNSSIDSKAENVESITDVPKDIQQVAANTESMQTETNSQSDVAIAEHKGAVHVESETEITEPVQVASEDNAHATSEDSNQKELVAKPETKQIDDFKDESEHKDELETTTPDKIDSEIELKKAAAQSQDATDALPIITNVHEDNKRIQVENIDSDLTEAISERAVSTETNNTTVQTIDNNDSVRVYEERVTHKSSPAPEVIDISPDNGVSSEDCGKYLTESTPEPPNLAEVEAVADRLVTEAIGDALAVAAATE